MAKYALWVFNAHRDYAVADDFHSWHDDIEKLKEFWEVYRKDFTSKNAEISQSGDIGTPLERYNVDLNKWYKALPEKESRSAEEFKDSRK